MTQEEVVRLVALTRPGDYSSHALDGQSRKKGCLVVAMADMLTAY